MGPRYRYFSKPPTTVTVKLGDLIAQIPPEARTSLFDASRSLELPAENILQGPVPKIRLSQLALAAPEAFAKTDDVLLRLPIARLAVSYKFVNSQELIEDKPLPPLEPLISSEGSFIPEDFTPPIEDTPPDDFAPPIPEIVTPVPVAETLPPPTPFPPSFTPPAPASDPAKPQGKKVFSILPMFRRKEQPTAPGATVPTPPPAPAPVEARPRVEIPKPRTILPPITARVAEAAINPPPAPVFTPEPLVETPQPEAEIPPFAPIEEAPLPPAAEIETPAAEPEAPAPSEAVWVETEHLHKSEPNPSAEIPDQDGLQSVFMTEEYLSLERVIELSGGLPGIKSCVLSQGRAILGTHNAPDNIDLVSLSANAVEMLQAMRQSAARMGVGAVPAVTIHSDKGPITFFHQEDLCLLVMHKDRGFVPGVREKLQQVVRELSRANLTLPVAPAKPSLGE